MLDIDKDKFNKLAHEILSKKFGNKVKYTDIHKVLEYASGSQFENLLVEKILDKCLDAPAELYGAKLQKITPSTKRGNENAIIYEYRGYPINITLNTFNMFDDLKWMGKYSWTRDRIGVKEVKHTKSPYGGDTTILTKQDKNIAYVNTISFSSLDKAVKSSVRDIDAILNEKVKKGPKLSEKALQDIKKGLLPKELKDIIKSSDIDKIYQKYIKSDYDKDAQEQMNGPGFVDMNYYILAELLEKLGLDDLFGAENKKFIAAMLDEYGHKGMGGWGPKDLKFFLSNM